MSTSKINLFKPNDAIKQLEDNVQKYINQIKNINNYAFDNINNDLIQRIQKVITILNQSKSYLISHYIKSQPINDTTLITPKKNNSSIPKHISFGYTSQIKTKQDFQSLASANDQLYKQFQTMLQQYHYNKQTLNHQNQVVLNQWIQNTNHISTISLNKQSKKSNFFTLAKTLIQQLSKYQSVEEYINSIELIQHQKIVNQLRSASLQTSDDQKKWLKQTTKQYLLKMAELFKSQDNNLTDDDQQNINDIEEEQIENMF